MSDRGRTPANKGAPGGDDPDASIRAADAVRDQPVRGLSWEEFDEIKSRELAQELGRPKSVRLEETIRLSRFAGELAAAGARARRR